MDFKNSLLVQQLVKKENNRKMYKKESSPLTP